MIEMRYFRTSRLAGTVMTVAAVLLSAPPAFATSARVTMACASDYLAYCSKHPTEGPGVRQCMRANGPRLSQQCVKALVAAGEVSKSEVQRREASAR